VILARYDEDKSLINVKTTSYFNGLDTTTKTLLVEQLGNLLMNSTGLSPLLTIYLSDGELGLKLHPIYSQLSNSMNLDHIDAGISLLSQLREQAVVAHAVDSQTIN